MGTSSKNNHSTYFFNCGTYVPNITINSGHNVSDIYKLLPSMKTVIQYIIKGETGPNPSYINYIYFLHF